MVRRRLWIVVLVLFSAFFLWRMVRPLNIFMVDDRFERPMAVATPEGYAGAGIPAR